MARRGKLVSQGQLVSGSIKTLFLKNWVRLAKKHFFDKSSNTKNIAIS
jgi:hypothetical protein